MLDDETRVPDGQALDADALLQASRRVDWRFLLPDPNLGHVAYVGPGRGALIESLRLFSTSLTLPETRATTTAIAQYDLVVTSGPSLEMLRRASWSGPAVFCMSRRMAGSSAAVPIAGCANRPIMPPRSGALGLPRSRRTGIGRTSSPAPRSSR
jgi:hypothetical protein